jgi:hypothetical protein
MTFLARTKIKGLSTTNLSYIHTFGTKTGCWGLRSTVLCVLW